MNQRRCAETLAQEFISISSQFRLGQLPTETPHIRTANLSAMAKTDLNLAIAAIQDVDIEVFRQLGQYLPAVKKLQADIRDTILNGGRIFLCGCGATGRLSLALEAIWRQKHENDKILQEKVISFMAGGDVALINSIERFEDFPEYGERQLKESGFSKNDLLISSTEGGETPFVIGATEAAINVSQRQPYFLYCNPDEILKQTAERSKKVIENPFIKKINLSVGAMALTGSTRMQATTILMYAIGLSLWFFDKEFNEIEVELSKVHKFISQTSFQFLSAFIKIESEVYKKGEYIFYETDEKLGISVLTDTTERSPTFSLYPFENQNDDIKMPSLAYLFFSNPPNSASAWQHLLGRDPRTFNWKDVTTETSVERLIGFDFSRAIKECRSNYLNAPHHHFQIHYNDRSNTLSFRLKEAYYELPLGDLSFLSAHILLKICLNNLSTLVMGRLDRFESNLMTWVRASNNKLVDRAIRFADHLLKQKGISISYEELVRACFNSMPHTAKDESLVLTIVETFLRNKE